MGYSGTVAATAPLDGACVVTTRTRNRTVGNGLVVREEEVGIQSSPFLVHDDHFVFVSVVLLIGMNEESLTVIILYGGSKYGLFISRDASVLDVKKEISVGRRVRA